jgi:hypothetical protein
MTVSEIMVVMQKSEFRGTRNYLSHLLVRSDHQYSRDGDRGHIDRVMCAVDGNDEINGKMGLGQKI